MDEKKRKMLYAASGVGIVLLVVFYWLFFASFSSSKAASYVYIDKDDTVGLRKVKSNGKAQTNGGLKDMCHVDGVWVACACG